MAVETQELGTKTVLYITSWTSPKASKSFLLKANFLFETRTLCWLKYFKGDNHLTTPASAISNKYSCKLKNSGKGHIDELTECRRLLTPHTMRHHCSPCYFHLMHKQGSFVPKVIIIEHYWWVVNLLDWPSFLPFPSLFPEHALNSIKKESLPLSSHN